MTGVRVFFATNRNYTEADGQPTFGTRFNPDGVAALRFGYAEFDGRLKRTRLTVYPDLATESAPAGSVAFLTDLRAVMAGERSDTMVFIHGFNVSFDGALAAGARLAASLRIDRRPVNIVVFTWPSEGQAVPYMSYYSDREDARACGPALARAYLKLRDYLTQLNAQDYCERCLHLLAHSMGAYVLRHGLQAVLVKDPTALTRLFDQILLAAPDEDDDAFETDQKLRLLPRLGRQVTVYFNGDDRALVISDATKGNPDRLGSDGPRLIDLIPKKVVLVDCRNVAMDADLVVGHSYYINSPAMAADLSAVLRGTAPEGIRNRKYILPKRVWRIVKDA